MKKLNIAEILKDCPKGMELDCTIFENTTFEEVKTHCSYPIKIITNGHAEFLTEYGCINYKDSAKCVIFPKGKTTWEGFKRPFKDGDVVATNNGKFIGIVKIENNKQQYGYVTINERNNLGVNIPYGFERLATEEEKQKLLDAIKANGYKWNTKTKTLEKLKVNKFDISTLMPFDKVLVRDNDKLYWSADIYSHHLGKDKPYQFKCIGMIAKQCIPYKENKHLLGTTNDCDEYYKTWE